MRIMRGCCENNLKFENEQGNDSGGHAADGGGYLLRHGDEGGHQGQDHPSQAATQGPGGQSGSREDSR